MSKIKKLAGETALYGLGSIIPRFLNFLLVPLHTINAFETGEYGDISKVYAFVAFANVVYLFGMETAFFRFATLQNDPKRIFNLAHTSVLLISVPLTLLLIGLSPQVTRLLNLNQGPDLIQVVALILLTDALVAIPFARLRLEKKALPFASYKIANVLVQVALNIYFLKFAYDPSIGIGYVFLANLIANLVYIPFFIKPLFNWKPAFDKKISPAMLSYSYPIMLTGLAGMTNEMFSRLTLEFWLPEGFYSGQSNKQAVGIFSGAYKFAVFMNLGIQAFRYAAEPFFFSNASEKNSPTLFARVNHYFVIIGCWVLVSVSLNLEILKYFIGHQYWQGFSIVPLLLLAYLLLGIYYNMSVWFKLTNNTHVGTLITVLGAFVTIGTNYLLIPRLGYTGSAIAAATCYLVMAITCYRWGQKKYPIPYTIGKDFAYIVASMAVVYVFLGWTQAGAISTMVIGVLLTLVVTVVVFLTERKGFTARPENMK